MVQRKPHACLEVPIFGSSSATSAMLAGAARLELNAAGSYPDGGTTPSVAELVAVNAALTSLASAGKKSHTDASCLDKSKHGVAVRVMIRPRGPPPPPPPPVSKQVSSEKHATERVEPAGIDFQYTPAEVNTMLASISELKPHLDSTRGDGFVFGALNVVSMPLPDGTLSSSSSSSLAPSKKTDLSISIDVPTCKTLLAAAAPFPCVFHRAFDLLVSPLSSFSSSSSSSSSSFAVPHRPDDLKSLTASTSDKIRDAVSQTRALGFAGILTSGGVGNAVDNLDNNRLAEIVTCAASTPGHAADEGVDSQGAPIRDNASGIEIILGGGVRSGNVVDILDGVAGSKGSAGEEQDQDRDDLAVQWVHSSCLTSKGSEDVDGDEVERIVDAISRR